MIRLGLRLTLGSGREAALRVLVTAAAVALGVGLLLFALAGVSGLRAQTDRGAWLDTSAQTPPSTSGGSTSEPLWWLLSVDQFGNQEIDRVDVAATGPGAPIPPGIPHLPGPGEFYASPALTKLLRSVPANELRDRFPGRQIGTIGAAALPSPNSLIIVVGDDVRQLSRALGAVEVRGIQQTPSNCFSCQSGNVSGPVLQWILAGGACALLLPVLVLIATASRLSAARREERFAAMRLVGATPRQISVIAAVESTVAAAAGVAVGFALFFVFRPFLIHVPFTGAPLAPGDLSLRWLDVVLVVLGVPIVAVVSARLALRRVRVSPLGVTRRTSSRAAAGSSGSSRFSAGIALLAYFDASESRTATASQIQELLLGLVLILVGLVLAGPWLTKVGSQLMANRASRPAGLIAARRLLDNPRAAFRSISGLVLALFVTSAAIGALGSIVATRTQGASARSTDTLVDQFCGDTTGCGAGTDIAVRPSCGADGAPLDAGGEGRDGGPREPIPRSELYRCGRLRRTGKDPRDRQVRAGSDGGGDRRLPPTEQCEQLRVLDDLAVRPPAGGERREPSRRGGRRRDERVVQLPRARTDLARSRPFPSADLRRASKRSRRRFRASSRWSRT